MSSRCRLARLDSVLVVGVEVVEDDAGQAAFEAAQCLGFGIAGIDAFAVIGAAHAIETDLCDGDAVQGCVELTVARAGHAHATGGVARPHRYRGHASMTSTVGAALKWVMPEPFK